MTLRCIALLFLFTVLCGQTVGNAQETIDWSIGNDCIIKLKPDTIAQLLVGEDGKGGVVGEAKTEFKKLDGDNEATGGSPDTLGKIDKADIEYWAKLGIPKKIAIEDGVKKAVENIELLQKHVDEIEIGLAPETSLPLIATMSESLNTYYETIQKTIEEIDSKANDTVERKEGDGVKATLLKETDWSKAGDRLLELNDKLKTIEDCVSDEYREKVENAIKDCDEALKNFVKERSTFERSIAHSLDPFRQKTHLVQCKLAKKVADHILVVREVSEKRSTSNYLLKMAIYDKNDNASCKFIELAISDDSQYPVFVDVIKDSRFIKVPEDAFKNDPKNPKTPVSDFDIGELATIIASIVSSDSQTSLTKRELLTYFNSVLVDKAFKAAVVVATDEKKKEQARKTFEHLENVLKFLVGKPNPGPSESEGSYSHSDRPACEFVPDFHSVFDIRVEDLKIIVAKTHILLLNVYLTPPTTSQGGSVSAGG